MTPEDEASDASTVDSKSRPASRKSSQGKRGRKRKRDSVASLKNGGVNEGEGEYEVENIVSHEVDDDKTITFCVKWKGWPDSTNTWESFDNLKENCLESIVLYFEKILGEKVEWTSQVQVFKKSIWQFTNDEIEITANRFIRPEGDQFPDISIEDLEQRINLVGRLPRMARDPKLVKELRNDCLIFEVKKRREFQLQNLAEWEGEINRISSDNAFISVVNSVDLDLRPLDFKYINVYKQNLPARVSDDPPIGCECNDCTKDICACRALSGDSIRKSAYNAEGLLVAKKGTPIYECNKKCACGPDCQNRVLQRGRTIKLSIFKTNNGCGWGIRTLEDIKKGQFVAEYVGEVITREEADKRGKVYDREGKTYLFDLDYNDEKDFPYTVDAAEYGNVSHFINHSCSPNLEIYAVWVHCLDPNMPRLGLYACKNIKAHEELTFDYICMQKDEKEKRVIPKPSEIKTLCKCNSSNCRTYLFCKNI